MFVLPGLYRESAWLYWLATVVPLALSLTVDSSAIYAAMLIVAVQALHYGLRQRSLTTLRVQVRFGYFALLVLGTWPPLFWLHWLQLAGTCAFLLFGYCPLARILSLAPWNRAWPLASSLVWRTFFSMPVAGNILHAPLAR